MSSFAATASDCNSQSECQAKRPRKSEAKGKGILLQGRLEKRVPWLETVTNERGEVVGLLCNLCKWHKCKNKFNQSTAWNEIPCNSIRKDAVGHQSHSAAQGGGTDGGLSPRSCSAWWDRANLSDAVRTEARGSEDSHTVPLLVS